MRYGLAAAGTGGHVYPALAVGEALVDSGVDRGDVVFFGGDRLEATAVPEAGFPFVPLDIRGFRRSFSFENATLPVVVRRAARTVATEIVARAVGALAVFGGYVTGPAVLGARRSGVPYLVHEQNAVPGMANRLARRGATRVMVAFEPATAVLRGARVVGNPLRRSITHMDRDASRMEALPRYEITGTRPVVGVLGGSQGAAALNRAVEMLLADRSLEADIVHLTGPTHLAEIEGLAAGDGRWHPFGFEDRMDRFYAVCDVAMARAGALTCSELAATATPAVLVPLPAGRGYQAKNALDLERAGGAVVFPQSEIGEAIARVAELTRDEETRAKMRAKAASVGHPDAAAVVADALMEVARG